MAKYEMINLNLTEEEKQRLADVEKKKIEGLGRQIQELVDGNDLPYIAFFTVASGATLGQVLDSILAAKYDLSKAFPHSFIGQVRSATSVREILDKVSEPEIGDVGSLDDNELVISFAHQILIAQTARQMMEVGKTVLTGSSINVQRAAIELDKRGISPLRAVLRPIKMNTKYVVLTVDGEFITSYNDQMIFSFEELVDAKRKAPIPNKQAIFIGNAQSDGDIHHLDDLPIFSTNTRLVFGEVGVPITKPIFVTNTVLHVTELSEIN